MENFFQICLNCGIMIYKAQVSHILDSLKIMWDWPQDIWQNLVSKGDAAEYSMQWKQMEASIRVIFYVMDEYQIGNFNTDSFDQMDQKRSEIRFIEQSSQVEKACRSCPYFLLCRGGCRRNRGNGIQIEPTRNNFCEGYKIFFEKWYDTLMQLGKLVQR